ncbi:hypothetical protein [Solirubrobacter soli]|uniref:hypothetical protein n=1 Tax=Solirubrobacter soli TaxID=363832 RepID=UPI000400540E|nr:hypothetical protein [Solirubrobacter soli]
MLDGLHANGIATAIHDGFADGPRAALTVTCTLPVGMLYTNVLLTVRDGRITRWFGSRPTIGLGLGQPGALA